MKKKKNKLTTKHTNKQIPQPVLHSMGLRNLHKTRTIRVGSRVKLAEALKGVRAEKLTMAIYSG